MTVQYISTRGQAAQLSFEEAVLAGLATDGGLYVPDRVPTLTPSEMVALQSLSYTDLAYRIISRFTGNTYLESELRSMITMAYSPFKHAAIAPIKQLSSRHYLLELFHGPTLAFKDFALQFLGQTLSNILARRNMKATVIGATSGDTGSAAIAGCSGHKNLDIFILFPEGRVSEVQRRQMTTVEHANVHALAVNGTFDDCQDIVKSLFSDAEFRKERQLIAVNSINWARILAQVVYYFYAALRLGAPAKTISFSVPTGNFGDIYAGYIAKRMGLPIDRLIIASNQNDILTRCLKSGTYAITGVTPTLSPSMDIQISSNFERLLFDLYGRDGEAIGSMMQQFRQDKTFTLTPEAYALFKAEFDAYAVDDAQTSATIKRLYEQTGELPDPHTAVGVAAAENSISAGLISPVVTLATAHPAKFPQAVEAATGIHPGLPAHLHDLLSRTERMQLVENSAEAVKSLIRAAIQ